MSRVAFGIALALAVVLSISAGRASRAAEFVPLLKGDGLDQLTLVKLGPESIAIDSGEVRLTGKPNGYFATKTAYHNYTLRFEWKYDRPESLASDAAFRGNSGVLFHITGPDKVWPRCIEAQLMNADAGNLLTVSGAKLRGAKKDAAAQRQAIKPVGEWNVMEITCRDGAIVTSVNGAEIARGAMADPDRGTIGWQSEGAPIRFRKLEIRVDDAKE